MIIALCGLPRVGKDTFANFFSSNTVQYAFATPIKQMICAAFGWDMSIFESDEKEKIDPFWHISPRHAMEYLGTDIMRRDIQIRFPEFSHFIGERIWVKRFEKFYYENKNKTIILTDLRYTPEYEFLSNIDDVKIIRINRPNYNKLDKSKWYDILKHEYNFEIDNDVEGDLDSYFDKSKNLMKLIGVE